MVHSISRPPGVGDLRQSGAQPRRQRRSLSAVAITLCAIVFSSVLNGPAGATVATSTVVLGAAASYSVLGGPTVSNTGPSALGADVGTSPGTAITGFPPGITAGALHPGDANAAAAQSDLLTAYNDAASRTSTATLTGDLAGLTLTPGVYTSAAALTLSANVTLDAQGDPSAVFIVRVNAAFSTDASSRVLLKGGAQASRIFWQITGAFSAGASATLVGTVMSNAAISIGAGASVTGRLLTLTGAVALASSSVVPEAPIDLGSAATFSALAETALTNTGPTILSGDIGVSPGTVIFGFPPGITSGNSHAGDGVAAAAQSDLAAAYIDAGARTPTATISGDLSGLTLPAGVYSASTAVSLSTDLTLDGRGNSNGVFIFQVGGAFSSSVASRISLINGAQPSHIFWRITGAATLGAGSYFRGTILDFAGIVVGANTHLVGRTLAVHGAVSMRTSPLGTTVSVALGTASTYAALGGTSIANTGATTLQGDVGVYPGTTISGFPPGTLDGTSHRGDAAAARAQADLLAAYNDAASRASTAAISGDLAGQTLTPGVYSSTAALTVSTSLTLDGQQDPNAIFIIQVNAAFSTAASSTIILTNGASATNVFWKVSGAVSVGAGSDFSGTILGFAAISFGANSHLVGRILSVNGAIALSTTTVTTPVVGVWYLTATLSPAVLNPITLNGTGTQFATVQTLEWIITDNRGTHAAWALSVTATTPTSAAGTIETNARSLPVTNLTITPGVVAARDRPGSSVGISAPQLTLSRSAQALVWSTGANPGSYTFNPTFSLAIPANAYRSNYSGEVGNSPLNPYVSTMTYTIC